MHHTLYFLVTCSNLLLGLSKSNVLCMLPKICRVVPLAISGIIRKILRATPEALTCIAIRNVTIKAFMTCVLPQQLQSHLPSDQKYFRRWIAKRQDLIKIKLQTHIDIFQDRKCLSFPGLVIMTRVPMSFCSSIVSVVRFENPAQQNWADELQVVASFGHLEWTDYFRTVGVQTKQ